MFQRDSRALGFHAAIIILLGMIAGIPFGISIVETRPEDIIRAWRTAHLLGVVNGLFVVAVAAMWAKIGLSPRLRSALWWCLVLGGYANTVAPLLAAIAGHRGLEPTGPAMNWAIFGVYQIAFLFFPAGVLFAIGLARRTGEG
jgi:hydroxylaminobenzene mutase